MLLLGVGFIKAVPGGLTGIIMGLLALDSAVAVSAKQQQKQKQHRTTTAPAKSKADRPNIFPFKEKKIIEV